MKLGPFLVDQLVSKPVQDISDGLVLVGQQLYIRCVLEHYPAVMIPLDGDGRFFEYAPRLDRKMALKLPFVGLSVQFSDPSTLDSQTMRQRDITKWPQGWLVVTDGAGACISVVLEERREQTYPYLVQLDGFKLLNPTNVNHGSLWFKEWRLLGRTASGDELEVPKGQPNDIPTLE